MDMGDQGVPEGTPEDRPEPGGGPPPMPSGPGWSTPRPAPAPGGAGMPRPEPPAAPGWNAAPPASPGAPQWTPPPPPPSPPGATPGWYAGPPGVPPPPPGYAYPGAPPPGSAGAAGLRPRGIGELLDAAFTLYRRNFVLLVAIAAVVQVPFAIVQLIVYRVADVGSRINSIQSITNSLGNQNGITPDQTTQLSSDAGAIFVYIGVVLLVQYFVVYPLSLAATTHAVSNRYLDQAATVGGSYRAAFSMWRSLIAMILLLAVMIGGAAAVAIVLGVVSGSSALLIFLFLVVMVFAIYVLVRSTLAAQSIVIERVGGRAGLRRSWALTRRAFWRIIGILLLLGILQAVVGAVFSLPILAAVSSASTDTRQMVSQAVQAVSAIFVAPVTLVTLTLVYYDLRIRREGFDIEMLTAAL